MDRKLENKRQALCVVLNHFGTSSEVFIIQLLRELSETFDVKIYVRDQIDRSSPWLKLFHVENLPSRKSLQFFVYALKNFQLIKNLKDLRRLYFKFRLDFMNGEKIYYPFISMIKEYSEFPELFSHKLIFTSIRGTDLTVTPYLDESVVPKYQILSKHIYKVHFLSEDLNELANSYNLKFDKDQVIYQGVDLNKWNRLTPMPTHKLKLITIGRLHYIKGLEFLLLVADELNKRNIDFELNIVGDGSEHDKLKFLMRSLGLQEKVNFCGKLSPDEVKSVMEDSNVYIHTHLVNGLSNTMLEAISMKLKVVTFDSNIASYAIKELKDAIIEIPRYDISSFADALIALGMSREFEVDENVRAIISGNFSLKLQKQKFTDFFSL
jgi:colanic acid/amylovoran biosynthesis glycosyltransferase